VLPNYNVYGHMHHMQPYKDKSHLFNQDVTHHKWLDPPPAIRSRSELQQARKAARVPDPRTYDFDGDGVVSQLDYFVGRSFDKDCDGRLTASERRQAEKACDSGYMDRFLLGNEAQHPRGKPALQQRRGVILSAATPDAMKDGYRPHFNAHKVPRHSTKTALMLERVAEMKGAAHVNGERFADRCAPVREPQPKNAQTEPRICPFAHIGERAEADGQASRVHSGLLPVPMPSNPERELRTIGMDYVDQPLIATRSQLNETRKELMKRDCEALRDKGEMFCLDLEVAASVMSVKEYDFRRAPEAPFGPNAPEPKTLTKLKDDRRCEKIEYNMTNFHHPDVVPREYPRYSDTPDVPFWTKGSGGGGSSSTRAATAPEGMSRMHSEPVLKVTEVPWKDYDEHDRSIQDPDAAAGMGPHGVSQDRPEGCLGTRTVKRWSADMLDHGQGLNKPRMFDNIRPPHIGPKDLEALDLTSSMEPIRRAALKKQAELRKQNKERPPKSIMSVELDPESSLDATSFMHPEKASKVIVKRVTRAHSQSGDYANTSAMQGFSTDFTNYNVARAPGLLLSSQRPRSEQSALRPMGIRSGGFQNLQDTLHMANAVHSRDLRRSRAASTSALRSSTAPAAPQLDL